MLAVFADVHRRTWDWLLIEGWSCLLGLLGLLRHALFYVIHCDVVRGNELIVDDVEKGNVGAHEDRYGMSWSNEKGVRHSWKECG